MACRCKIFSDGLETLRYGSIERQQGARMSWIKFEDKSPELNQQIWFRDFKLNNNGISIFLGLDTWDNPIFRNPGNARIVVWNKKFEWKPFIQPERSKREDLDLDMVAKEWYPYEPRCGTLNSMET